MNFNLGFPVFNIKYLSYLSRTLDSSSCPKIHPSVRKNLLVKAEAMYIHVFFFPSENSKFLISSSWLQYLLLTLSYPYPQQSTQPRNDNIPSSSSRNSNIKPNNNNNRSHLRSEIPSQRSYPTLSAKIPRRHDRRGSI